MSTTAELTAANEQMRAAIEGRQVQAAEAACCEGAAMPCYIEPGEQGIPHDWILRGDAELRQQPEVKLVGDSLLKREPETPAEQLLEEAQRTIRNRRSTYGPPVQHFAKTVGMINAAFADVLVRPLTPADWAIIMSLDKIARHQGPHKTHDTPIDLSGYAACLAECEATPATG